MWPLLLLIGGGKSGRVYCDKWERQVAIDGCCDKRGFTVNNFEKQGLALSSCGSVRVVYQSSSPIYSAK